MSLNVARKGSLNAEDDVLCMKGCEYWFGFLNIQQLRGFGAEALQLHILLFVLNTMWV
jgi:hypothetical protein